MRRQVLCLLLLGLTAAGTAAADPCLSYVGSFFSTSTNCEPSPVISRILGFETMLWNSRGILVGNLGNEMQLWTLDTPLSPQPLGASDVCRLWPGGGGAPCTAGGVAYNLVNMAVCDDCRFAVANYSTGTVLIDLGAGATPSFGSAVAYTDADDAGGFTFSYGDQQYLITKGFGGGCGSSALYEISGVDPGDISFVECVGRDVLGGTEVPGPGGPYLWLGTGTNNVAIYRVVPVADGVTLDFLDDTLRGVVSRGKGFDVDVMSGLAATAYYSSTRIYDIGWSSGSPDAPVLLATISHPSGDWVSQATLAAPVLTVAYEAGNDTVRTYDLSDPTSPQPLDADFWSPAHPWNDFPCVADYDTAVSPDGLTLYLARYSRAQAVDLSGCFVDEPPAAAVGISPQTVFPGETVAIANQSTGPVSAARIWATSVSDPSGPVVCQSGATLTSPPPQLLDCLVPAFIHHQQEMWAHVAVENASYPYPGADQLASRQVGIDRAPEATIQVQPASPLPGDTVTLTAVAEGFPTAYQWLVTPPGGGATADTGQQVQVVVSPSGLWTFDLEVEYSHWAADGSGLYSYETSVQLQVGPISDEIFIDGFESGDTSAWSAVVP